MPLPAGHEQVEQDRAPPLQLHLHELALTTYRTIVELIAATTTRKCLRVRAERDTEFYETGVKVPDADLAAVPLQPHDWHGEWNYTSARLGNQSCGEP